MKFKYCFVLFLILTAIFLLGNVAASDNVDFNTNTSDETYLSTDEGDEQYLSSNTDSVMLSAADDEDMLKDPSSDDAVDLIVNMEVGETKKTTYGINQIIFDVPLIITANVNGGIAKNARIHLTIPEDFEYVSDDGNIGTYDSGSGTWNIGDLNSGVTASLTIFTKISKKGDYVISVNGTCDSNDVNLSNNDLNCNIQVSSKITSNTTRTSADSSGARHDTHYASEGNNRPNEDDGKASGDGDSNPDGKNDYATNTKTDTGTDSNIKAEIGFKSGGESKTASGNGKSSDSEGSKVTSRDNAIKEINPNIIAKVTKSISDTIDDVLRNDSTSNDDSNNHLKTVKAISLYNYAQVPILIFALFFIVLIGMFGYDRLKS